MQKSKEEKEAEALKKLIARYNRNDGMVVVYPGQIEVVEFPFGKVRLKRMISGTVYILQNNGQHERLNRKWYAKAEKWINTKDDKELKKYIHLRSSSDESNRNNEDSGTGDSAELGTSEPIGSETNQP